MGIDRTTVSRLALATAIAVAAPACAHAADLVDYASGEIREGPILIPAAGTNLRVATGSATQRGLADALGAAGAIEKTGDGLLSLTSDSTATGRLTVSAGTLQLDGLLLSPVSVANATFVVNGTAGTVDVGSAGVFINNGVTASAAVAGRLTNNGRLGTLALSAGEAVNNGAGVIEGTATIAGGTLTNNGSMAGATLLSGGSLLNNTTGVVTGTITTAGTLTNGGTLAGLVQQGGTVVNNGTVGGDASATAGTLVNNGAMAGVAISGTAVLVNNSAGTLTTLDAAGGLAVNSGTIGDAVIGADAGFINNASGTVAGTLETAGSGVNGGTVESLLQTGGLFHNAGTITGGASVAAGEFSSTGRIAGGFDNAATASLSGVAEGGIVNRAGATLSLSGALEGDSVLRNDGTLAAGGIRSLSGFERVENNGLMAINGALSITAVETVSSGTIMLSGNGSPTDTLAIEGALTLADTARTVVDVTAAGASDTIAVSGAVRLAGTLELVAESAAFGVKTGFDIVTSAADAVSGAFAALVVSRADLFASVKTTSKGARLTLRDAGALAAEEGFGAAGNILSGFDFSGADGNAVFDAIAGLEGESAQAGLLSTLSGTADAGLKALSHGAAQGFNRMLQTVAATAGFGGGGGKASGLLAYDGEAPSAAQQAIADLLTKDGERNVWVRSFGEFGESASAPALSTTGAAAGLDARFAGGITAGFSAGYSVSHFGDAAAGVSGETQSLHAGAYLAHGATAPESAGFGLAATAGYTFHMHETERDITIGALSRTAEASFTGGSFTADLMMRHGITLDAGGRDVTIAPVAGLRYVHTTTDAYQETGAGTLDLSVDAAVSQSLTGMVGGQVAARIVTDRIVFVPHFTALYQHEFLDPARPAARRLNGAAEAFAIESAGASPESLSVEIGLGMEFASGLRAGLAAQGVWSADGARYGVTGTLKARF